MYLATTSLNEIILYRHILNVIVDKKIMLFESKKRMIFKEKIAKLNQLMLPFM